MIERIRNEGEFRHGGHVITVDAGRLWRAGENDIFQVIDSDVLNERIPQNLRDPEGLWFGLSKRVRVIAFNKAVGLPIAVTRYEDLANPALISSVCMRSSSNIYNLSLMSSVIEAQGRQAEPRNGLAGLSPISLARHKATTPHSFGQWHLASAALPSPTTTLGRLIRSDDPQKQSHCRCVNRCVPQSR